MERLTPDVLISPATTADDRIYTLSNPAAAWPTQLEIAVAVFRKHGKI
jgi:hypothetical protein